MQIAQRPLFCWTLAFIAGLCARGNGWLSSGVCFVVAGLSLIALCAALKILRLLPVCVLIVAFAVGALRMSCAALVVPDDVSRLLAGSHYVTVMGRIASPPQSDPGRLLFPLSVERLKWEDRWIPAGGAAEVVVRNASAARAPDFDEGDTVTVRGLLSRPKAATNPGEFSWRDYLAHRGILSEIRADNESDVRVQDMARWRTPEAFAARIHRAIVSRIAACLVPDQAGIVAGVLVGGQNGLSSAMKAAFVHTGAIHLLASAGLHVGVIACFLFFLLSRLTVPRRLAIVTTVSLLALYALVAGERPSVERAVIVAVVYFGAYLFEREPDLPTSLAAAALLILAVQPWVAFEPGFQLSFLTVATIAFLMPVWEMLGERLRLPLVGLSWKAKAVSWVWEFAGLSIAAQLGAAPIVAVAYNEVSASGIAANLLAVPALFVILPFGLVGVVVSYGWTYAGYALIHVAGWGAAYVAAVIQCFGSGSSGYTAVAAPPAWAVAIYYFVLWGIALVVQNRRASAENPDSGVSRFAASAVVDATYRP